jgi:predicted RNA binding protein YcfA (HicA-like mRNA interferase family)
LPRAPVVTGAEALRALQLGGFLAKRQSWSHVIIHDPARDRTTAVPVHSGRPLSPGLLHDILRQAGVTMEEFRHWLR